MSLPISFHGEFMENTKGVTLIKMEDGQEKYYTKYNYLLMKKAGRSIELVAEAPTKDELDKKLRRLRGFSYPV